MGLLSDRELASLLPAETHAFAGPIPTQSVSSDEFLPAPQTQRQRQVEARVRAMGDALAKKHGMTRRRFLTTASGMAAAFLAMNEVYGALYDVSVAEAQAPGMAKERADALSKQFVMDCHTHFLRDDTRIMTFVRQRQAVGKAGWNKALADKAQTIEDLKFANYYKEVFLDSDTKVALISGAPSEVPQDWYLTNEMKAEARARVNKDAGSRRMLSHAIFTPGYPGWMEQVDHALRDLKPDSFKGYTIGDNTSKNLSKHPWRMDDDKLVYPFYEKLLRAGYDKVCVHKGLFPPSVEQQFPHLLAYSDVRDVGKAARDWPKINFIIYHGGYRFAGGGKVEDDGLAPVADRGAAAPGDPRGDAEAVRLQAARGRRRPGEECDPRRDQRAAVHVRAARRAGHRPHRRAEGGIRAGGRPAEQPALRLRGGVAGLTTGRPTSGDDGRAPGSRTRRRRARNAGT